MSEEQYLRARIVTLNTEMWHLRRTASAAAADLFGELQQQELATDPRTGGTCILIPADKWLRVVEKMGALTALSGPRGCGPRGRRQKS